jgi:hypothetical protein
MSDAKAMHFPRVETPSPRPDWIDADPQATPVRSLLSHLAGEPAEPRTAAEPYQEWQPPDRDAANAENAAEERPLSRLPPPPKIGSLIPGARSAPPPPLNAGNEIDPALLRQHEAVFVNAAMELAIARGATLSELEGQLLDLSIEIAAALIEREVERAPELHAALARAALASLGDTTHVTLRTSPEGFAAIREAIGGEKTELRGVRIQLVSDPNIPGLGCVVDGDNVRIDATVSERLRAVRRAFEDERRKSVENLE